MDIKVYEDKMEKTLSNLQEEYVSIRAGRANPHILDKIQVDYYGTMTPVNQVGNISVADAKCLVISPWDASLLKGIEKAIIASNIGINPTNDGKVIRLVFPDLTEERRRELTKVVKGMGEDAKVAVRNLRRDANTHVDRLCKDKEISEDDQRCAETEIQKITDRFIGEVDKVVAEKDKEIMTV